MDDEWNDSPSTGAQSSGFASENVDSGRNFSKGRGFTKAANDDGGWGGDSNDDNSGSSRGGGRGNRGGGRGDRGGRGSRGGSYRNNNYDNNANGDGDDWGASSGGSRGGRGKGRGGSRGGRSDEWGGNSGDNENNGDSLGGGNDDGGGGGWGGASGDGGSRGGRGGRGGRGSRGGGRGGHNDNDGGDFGGENAAPEKPREIYIPPDPTDDPKEMFGTGIESGINFENYDNIPVEVTGDGIIPAITSFVESGLRPILLENVKKSGYSKPTPIQKVAIPIIMGGRDVMACAQTGSGKTAAFLLPIIHTLLTDKVELFADGSHCEPQVVIVSPTRELAIQIGAEARKFAHDSMIKTVVTYGGASVNHQVSHIMNGCHILVATPGRMNDFVSRSRITFSSVRFIVLDEADRMLDMGFLPAIEQMMSHETMVATADRQTLMFSATFPEQIQRLAARFLNEYLFITVGIVGGACTDVMQIFHEVDKFQKRPKLLALLNEEGVARTLVFVETKRNADFIATYLSENNLRTTSIHGDRLQREREEALRDFKTGHRDILVATDVAARGLDIKNVKHVINYDLPKSIDEYVHRIGRTGRVGNRGKATSFYDSSHDGALAPNLVRILKQAQQTIPEWLQSAASSGGGNYSHGGFGGRDVRGGDDFGQATDFGNIAATEENEDEW